MSGTPSRVTGLDLRSRVRGLSGSIPSSLTELTELDTLGLSGNDLAGCIPLALYDVDTNDLSSLGLSGCVPPPPRNLTGSALYNPSSQTWTITLTWDAPDDATVTEYVVKRKTPGRPFTRTLTGNTDTEYVDSEGIVTGTQYTYRVKAKNSAGESVQSLRFRITPN